MTLNPDSNNLFRFAGEVFFKKIFLFICFTGTEGGPFSNSIYNAELFVI